MSSPSTLAQGEQVVYSGNVDHSTHPADLRLLHYNDVYHVEPGSQ